MVYDPSRVPSPGIGRFAPSPLSVRSPTGFSPPGSKRDRYGRAIESGGESYHGSRSNFPMGVLELVMRGWGRGSMCNSAFWGRKKFNDDANAMQIDLDAYRALQYRVVLPRP